MTVYEVIKCDWDSNGAHHVEVRTNGDAFATDRTVRKARDLAKRSVSRPQDVKWTRHDGRYLDYFDGTPNMVYRFTVSRLDRL